ncbi:MAG: hypothetical protein G5Z42_06380 [Caldisphaeraceae archaeon]|nr:hypothetical protein [Caldisphaeraceae archaeon]MEB3691265.1 hypothetical protein [Caldisphaeraceae archaeon]MEB3798424.1 hypothetical protein [Caldisphaeraceae archaeon]
MKQVQHKRSQSAIVGTVIFIIALFIIAGVMLALINDNQRLYMTQKSSIQTQRMASLLEKSLLAYYNYNDTTLYITLHSGLFPYSYYISGISIILSNGSYLIFDQSSNNGNLNITVNENGIQASYNSLPVTMVPNSSALIEIKNLKSAPVGVSISVRNGEAVAAISAKNIEQLASSLLPQIIVPPTKLVYNKKFNVTFQVVRFIGIPADVNFTGYFSFSFNNVTKTVIGSDENINVYNKSTETYYYYTYYYIIIITIQNNTYNYTYTKVSGLKVTFYNISSGRYYYYNISSAPVKINGQTVGICIPYPQTGLILVNENTYINVTYICNVPKS